MYDARPILMHVPLKPCVLDTTKLQVVALIVVIVIGVGVVVIVVGVVVIVIVGDVIPVVIVIIVVIVIVIPTGSWGSLTFLLRLGARFGAPDMIGAGSTRWFSTFLRVGLVLTVRVGATGRGGTMRVMFGDCSAPAKSAALRVGIKRSVLLIKNFFLANWILLIRTKFVFRRGWIVNPTKLTDLVVGGSHRDRKEKKSKDRRFQQRVAAHISGDRLWCVSSIRLGLKNAMVLVL